MFTSSRTCSRYGTRRNLAHMHNEGPPYTVASLLIIFSFGLIGCAKNADPAQWDVDLLAPLITTTFTIGDIIPDSLLVTNSNGAITLLYQSELFAVDLDTVLTAPDTTMYYGGGLPAGQGTVNLFAGFPFVSENEVARFDLEDLQLRTLVLREGTLSMELRNEIQSAIFGSFSLPGAIFPNGTNMIEASVGPGTVANPTYNTVTRDLAGTALDLRGPAFNDVNTMATSISMLLDPNGNGADVTEGDSVIAKVTYSGLRPQYAKGYFGNRTIHIGPETTDLDLFQNIISGTLDVDDVALRLRVENGVGVDVQVALNYLQATNNNSGGTVDLASTLVQGPINLNRALDLGNTFQPSIYQNTIDPTNSNVDLFFEALPDRIGYELDLNLNPLGDISNGNDFLYWNSTLKASLELELPLRLIASDLTLEQIVTVDLPGTAEAHGLQSAELKLFATNGFPFSAGLELDILDSLGNWLSSVPTQGTIASALLGGNGIVSSSVASQLSAQLDVSRTDMLYNGGKLRIRVAFITADQTQHVQIYDTYRMDLQVTAGAHYLVNGDE